MNIVAKYGITCSVNQIHPVTGIECNQITRTCYSSTNEIAGGATLNLDAIIRPVSAVESATRVSTDIVALNDIVVGVDLDAFEVVRDQVACRGLGATDCGVMRT